jgi:uncharacterized protein
LSRSALDAIKPARPLPQITEMNEYFWCGGADGTLRILRCGACGHWIHPYAARCPKCRSDSIAPQATCGRGTVVGFTVNHQAWVSGIEVPYVVAIVELEEQRDLRLMTNMPRTAIEQVCVGLAVKVFFEKNAAIFVPLFEAA